MSSNCYDSTRCPVGEEMAGFSYVQGLRAMVNMAQQLGHRVSPETVAHYQNLAASALRGFHGRFWNSTSQSYGSDLSGQQMLLMPALTIDAMPDAAVRARVVQLLRTDLFNRSGHHLQIGAVTSKEFLSVLSSYGLHSSALRVKSVACQASQRTEPSWGYWLEQGATTCWEKWPGDTSRNHIFLCGGFGEWLWKSVLGLQRTSAAFATVRVAPRLDGYYGPSRASGRFNSPRGEIYVAWDRSDAAHAGGNATSAGAMGRIALQVKLPLGVAMAAVLVPPPYEPPSVPADEVVCATGSQHGAKQVAINSQNSLKNYPKVVHLECSGGGHIHSIRLASYSASIDTSTSCDMWTSSSTGASCQVSNASAVVQSMCLDRQRCSITLSNETFGPDPCPHEAKTLAVRAICHGGVVRERASKYVVTEGGQMIWDGSTPIKPYPDGIISAQASNDANEPGLLMELRSGEYFFESRLTDSHANR